MTASRNRTQVARNFVERYGPERLREILHLFAAGVPGPEIAVAFAVSRERVRQWKITFGTEVTVYQIHPEVVELLEG